MTSGAVRIAVREFLDIAPSVGTLRTLVWTSGGLGGIDEDVLQLYEQRHMELKAMLKRAWRPVPVVLVPVRITHRKPITEDEFDQLIYDRFAEGRRMVTREAVLRWAYANYEIVREGGCCEGAD